MSSRHPTTHKLFKRTSKQPWEHSKKPQSPGGLPKEFKEFMQAIPIQGPSRPSRGPFDRKECSISLVAILDDSPDTTSTKNMGDSGSHKHSGSTKMSKNLPEYLTARPNEDMKLTYIPIQSLSTLNSLPPTNKRITLSSSRILSESQTFCQPYQPFQPFHPFQPHQACSCSCSSPQQSFTLRKQVELLTTQQKYWSQKYSNKMQENEKLCRELEYVKKCNYGLEGEIKKLRENFNQMDRNFKFSQISVENSRRNLEAAEFRRDRAQQHVKELVENGLKFQMELRLWKERNSELVRLLTTKENQVIQANTELQRQSRKLKSILQPPHSPSKPLHKKSLNQLQNNPQPPVPSQKPRKCNRFIQTEFSSSSSSCSQTRLKEVQLLSSCLKQKIKTINQLDQKIQQLSDRVKEFQNMESRLMQYQVLNHDLNQIIFNANLGRLTDKYRYL